jgi:hypothetical protein
MSDNPRPFIMKNIPKKLGLLIPGHRNIPEGHCFKEYSMP